MVAVSETQGLTARQAKRKDWWKVRRAKSKTQDGSTDAVSMTPEDTESPDPATKGADVSTDTAPVIIKPEDPNSAKVKTEKEITPKMEAVMESTDAACQKTETPSELKRKKRKVSSVAEETEVIRKVQKVEDNETPKESKAAKRRRRLQKLKLYRSQETPSAVKTKDEFHAEASGVKSEEVKKTTENITHVTRPRKTRAATRHPGGQDGNSDKNSQQPVRKKKKGKFPKLYIAFVGNLPYDVKEDDIKWHFNKEGGVKDVRLLTVKDTAKPRGCAFVEFVDNASLMRGIDLHHSQLGWRTINVEVSSRGKKKNSKTQPRSRARTKSTDGRKKTTSDNSSSNETQSDA